jgi:hypothetical protein
MSGATRRCVESVCQRGFDSVPGDNRELFSRESTMRRKGFLLLMITLLVGWAAVLHAQPKEVVFKLKPRGDCDEIASPPDQPFDIDLCVARCLGEWVSVCAYSEGEGGQINSEGYTVAVEAWDPRVEFVEVELGRDVDDDQVNFFSPAIINSSGHTTIDDGTGDVRGHRDGRQWLIANVIFETNGGFDTLAIPVGETNSISLIDFRIALGQNWGDDDSLESEVYLTDEAELNGFRQRNQVTEGGLSVFADIDSAQGSIRIPLHGPRIEIKSCEFVPRDRKTDPYQIRIEWEMCGECPVYWWYRDDIIPTRGRTSSAATTGRAGRSRRRWISAAIPRQPTATTRSRFVPSSGRPARTAGIPVPRIRVGIPPAPPNRCRRRARSARTSA